MSSQLRVDNILPSAGTALGIGTVSGSITFNSNISGDTIFNNDVTINGVLTYEDVTNIDSVGIITARRGIVSSGVVTATAFHGDGSALTGITGTTINNNADNRLITGSGTANTLEGEANLTFNGSKLVLAANSTAYDAFQVGDGLFIGNTTNNVSAAIFHQGGGADLEIGSQDVITFTTGSTAGNATERLRITSDGQIGMGIASPTQESGRGLHIRGANGGQTRIHLTNSDTGDTATDGFYIISQGAESGGASGEVMLQQKENKSLKFATNNIERLRITSGGDVLVGGHSAYTYDDTGATNVILDIYGGATAGKRGILSLSGRSGNNDADLGTIWFNNDNNSGTGPGNTMKLTAAIQAKSVTSDSNAQNDSGSNLRFYTKPEAGALAERLRLTSSGLFGIATDDPSYRLDIGDGVTDPPNGYQLRVNANGDYIFALQRRSVPSFSIRNNSTGIVHLNTQNSKILSLGVSSGNASGSIEDDVRIDSNGHLTIVDGNLVVANGHGIDFSATSNGSGSMGSELFDDYEEGTWTPTMNYATGYGTQSGTYVKAGRTVHVWFEIQVTGWSTGTASTWIRNTPFGIDKVTGCWAAVTNGVSTTTDWRIGPWSASSNGLGVWMSGGQGSATSTGIRMTTSSFGNYSSLTGSLGTSFTMRGGFTYISTS